MQPDKPEQFSLTTITLHWLVAIGMIGMLAIGIYMTEAEVYSLYPWHKSFGVLIIAFVVLRVLWRIKNGWPVPVSQYIAIEQNLAKAVHWILIIGTVLMPVSGALMSALGGNGIDIFGLELMPRNPDPENPGRVLPHNGDIASFCHAIHHWLGYIVIGAVILHIAGAIKHHVIDQDATLKRMLGARRVHSE
ncbi:cytochrome b561 family protein [Elysia marginata]|uniref:Cytochrome b561 family protein n=1 Tax=Elysia marginata TaxID=1093978 RepID=A0AAV4EG87_9GAST|nr:cytochrome b561 family protein [Elysia marginata]